jgi:hypothetical protein
VKSGVVGEPLDQTGTINARGGVFEREREGISIEESLDLSHRGDQTLAELIKGFLFQLETYGDTGIR